MFGHFLVLQLQHPEELRCSAFNQLPLMVAAFKARGDASSGLTDKMTNTTPFQEHLLMPGLMGSAPEAPFQESATVSLPLMTQQV